MTPDTAPDLQADLSVETLHEIRARFSTPEALDEAVARLSMAGFDRADFSIPGHAGHADADIGAPPATTDADGRQVRTLATSLAAAAGAMAGGSDRGRHRRPRGGGGGDGGGRGRCRRHARQHRRHRRARCRPRRPRARGGNRRSGLSVRTPTSAKRDLADSIAREAGAVDVVAT